MSRQRLLRDVEVTVVDGLEFDRWHVVEAAVQPGVVEPVHPAQRGELEVVDGAPRPPRDGRTASASPDGHSDILSEPPWGEGGSA